MSPPSTAILRPLALILAALLAGCSGAPEQIPAAPTPRTDAAVAEPPVRPFPSDTLYQLLVAEFAGIRDQASPALEIYVAQGHETRDPAVIERGIRIATFIDDNDAVLDLARLWVEVAPEDLDVRRLATFQLARAGHVVEAFPHAEYLLEAGDDEHLQALAAYASDASDEERARLLVLYEELSGKYPERVGLMVGQAMLLRHAGRLQESLDLARRAVRIDPHNETGLLLSAQLLHQLDDISGAERVLEKALAIEPESKRLRLQYARFLAESDLTKSRDQMAILVNQYPDDPDLIFSLALANQELGNHADAREGYETLLNRRQRMSDAHYQLGRLAESQGNEAIALDQYRRVSQGQSLLTAAVRIVDILIDQGDIQGARQHLDMLRNNLPAAASSFYQIEAEMLSRLNRLNDARQVLDRALADNPDDIGLLYARSVVNARLEDIPASERDLEAILARDPENATALNALGYTLANSTDRYAEAYALINKAMALDPENPAIIDSLGWVYYRMGKLDKALEYLQRAYESFPDGEVAAHLGEVLWAKGRLEEARNIWLEGLKKSPGNPIITETMERLTGSSQDTPGTDGTP